MGKVVAFRPLTIHELRQKADCGELTPQDIEQIAWIRTARRIWAPTSEVELLVKELAEFMRAYRQTKGLTASALGAKVGLQASFISQIETGCKRQLTLTTINRIANACDCRLELRLLPLKQKKVKRA